MDAILEIRAILEKVSAVLHIIGDLISHPLLPAETRRDLVEEVHRLADEIGE